MNRGDFDAALDELDPDIEWVDPPDFPDRRPTFRGREALRSVWLEYVEPFEDFRFETDEFTDAGDRTFHVLKLAGRGKQSQASVEMVWYQVGVLGSDGKAVRLENYFDRESALEAAGLRQRST